MRYRERGGPPRPIVYLSLPSNRFLLLIEFLTHKAAKELDADAHLRAFGNDNVGITLRRFYKLEMHRPDRAHVLVHRMFVRAPAFGVVALQTAYQAHIVRCIHKDTHIEQVQNTRLRKDQYSFDYYHRPRLDYLD